MHRMCGRYSLTTPIDALRDLFQIDALPNLPPRYNIAPTQDVLAVRTGPDGGGRSFTAFRWGLIPSWAKDPAIGSRMINARAETAAEKPAFRAAFRRRRCLIAADGFYEWTKDGTGGKQPWRIASPGGAPFAFAGLWENWMSPDGSEIESCTIVTTEAADAIAELHHRMPVILDPADYDRWLTADPPQEAAPLMRPYAGALEFYPVTPRVNNVRNDDASVLERAEPVEDAPPAQGSLF
jgi:putative SOS response-associated peptidase YedK